jgi:hypothetical protein
MQAKVARRSATREGGPATRLNELRLASHPSRIGGGELGA